MFRLCSNNDMENRDSRFAHSSGASTNERASPEEASSRGVGAPPPAAAADSHPEFDPPLISDCLGDSLAETLSESFPPGGRKPRHDGFTPEKMAEFLRQLAATGVVDHAARAAGISTTAAYNFRNRREGRAFASMWDAVLVNRARSRLAGELQSRAIGGCVSVRKRDGVVVSEYHYYDNRLAMALLTRLDRLAEKEAASEAHLRALSEDLDGFIDCLAEGGDADSFVEERRPACACAEDAPAPSGAPAPSEPGSEPPSSDDDDDPELTAFARLSGCPDYRDVSPIEIDVEDLDVSCKGEWSADQWVRAYRSGFMAWLEMRSDEEKAYAGPGTALEFYFHREAAIAERDLPEASAEPVAGEDAAISLDLANIWEWSDDELVRAWRGGLLSGLPASFWDDLAEGGQDEEAEE